jgi:glycosyltransferase involved in cell wall biosynthesis
MIKKFNKTIFVSTNDGLVHNNLMDRISIVPNGVDTEYFKISEQNNVENNSIIFTGHMNFLPNIQAVLFFINQIFPIIKREIPQLKFYIVGAEPPKEIFDFHGRDGIIVTGAVKDIRPYLARAALFIAPMISGAGIKNKILQAMAMSKPIISTQLGIEALNVADNKELIIANNPLDFANKTVFLLQDKALRDSLGLYARHKVEKDYKWEELITKYKRIYMENLSCCS